MSNRAAVIIAFVVAFIGGVTFVNEPLSFILTITALGGWVAYIVDLNGRKDAARARREHRLAQTREDRLIRR